MFWTKNTKFITKVLFKITLGVVVGMGTRVFVKALSSGNLFRYVPYSWVNREFFININHDYFCQTRLGKCYRNKNWEMLSIINSRVWVYRKTCVKNPWNKFWSFASSVLSLLTCDLPPVKHSFLNAVAQCFSTFSASPGQRQIFKLRKKNCRVFVAFGWLWIITCKWKVCLLISVQ